MTEDLEHDRSLDAPELVAVAPEESDASVEADLQNLDAAFDPPETLEGLDERSERVMERSRDQRGELLALITTQLLAEAEAVPRESLGQPKKEPGMAARLTSGAVDFVPFVGGAKMLYEGMRGSTMIGQEMRGKERLIHAILGATSLGLDAFTAGTAGTAARAGAKAAPRLLVAGEKLALKGSVRSARVLASSAKLLERSPALVDDAVRFLGSPQGKLLVKQARATIKQWNDTDTPDHALAA